MHFTSVVQGRRNSLNHFKKSLHSSTGTMGMLYQPFLLGSNVFQNSRTSQFTVVALCCTFRNALTTGNSPTVQSGVGNSPTVQSGMHRPLAIYLQFSQECIDYWQFTYSLELTTGISPTVQSEMHLLLAIHLQFRLVLPALTTPLGSSDTS